MRVYAYDIGLVGALFYAFALYFRFNARFASWVVDCSSLIFRRVVRQI